MVGARFQVTGGLMLVGLWLGVRSLPIRVEPSEESLEPQQKVSERLVEGWRSSAGPQG